MDAVADLTQELARPPTVDEIGRGRGVTEEILDAMEALQGYSTSSLDAPGGEEARPDRGDRRTTRPSRSRFLGVGAAAVGELPPRERKGCTSLLPRHHEAEIANDLGISQMHVSRILS